MVCLLPMLMAGGCGKTQQVGDIAAAVKATSPVAYYRLDSTSGKSETGSSTYQFTGGATNDDPGPAGARFAMLNGKDGWVKTTQMGGIGQTASIMAWVKLEKLPKEENHIFYVAGESQNGNDFDLQFEQDNKIKFFTSGGGVIEYAPDTGTLTKQWHMIVATMDAAAPSKTLFWDGKLVAQSNGGSNPTKTSVFTIGESPVFTGRFFHGGIAEVALWDRVLSAGDVASIYRASGR